MPIIRAKDAANFALPGLSVVGLAAPSRGARETSVWRVRVDAGSPGAPHTVDREEIFVALSGYAVATLGDERVDVSPGDTLVVPPGVEFSLASREGFEAICMAPAGLRACMPRGEWFSPPWTQ